MFRNIKIKLNRIIRQTCLPAVASAKAGKYALFAMLALAVLIAYVYFTRDTKVATAGWWNDAWNYRKAITINHEQVAGDLTDYPLLVKITDIYLGSHANSDGSDIVFIASNGEKLKHEIESFATSTGALTAWVKMPVLSSSQDETIYMYYGHAGIGLKSPSYDDFAADPLWTKHYSGGVSSFAYDSDNQRFNYSLYDDSDNHDAAYRILPVTLNQADSFEIRFKIRATTSYSYVYNYVGLTNTNKDGSSGHPMGVYAVLQSDGNTFGLRVVDSATNYDESWNGSWNTQTIYYVKLTSNGLGSYAMKAWTDNWDGTSLAANCAVTSSRAWTSPYLGLTNGFNGGVANARQSGWIDDVSISSPKTNDYYGVYPGEVSAEDAAGVWDANYRGVWHMPDSSLDTVERFTTDPSWTEHYSGNICAFDYNTANQRYDFTVVDDSDNHDAAYRTLPVTLNQADSFEIRFKIRATSSSSYVFNYVGLINTNQDGTGNHPAGAYFVMRSYNNTFGLRVVNSTAGYEECWNGSWGLNTTYYVKVTSTGANSYALKAWTDTWDGATKVSDCTVSSSRIWNSALLGITNGYDGGTAGANQSGWIDDIEIRSAKTSLYAVDSTGRGYSAGLYGPSATTSQIVNARAFNGTSDYLSPGSVGAVKALSFWMKADDTTDREVINIDNTRLLKLNTISNLVAVNFPSPTIYVDGAAGSSVSTGWHYITVTDATGIATSALEIGRATSSYFLGGLDEVRVSDTVRSANWIATEYNNQASPATFLAAQTEETGTGPAAYWAFDEGRGPYVYDQSGHGHNGQLGLIPSFSSSSPAWQDESMCVSGKCLNFDGSNDYADAGNSGSLSFNQTDSKFSVATWAKLNSFPTGAEEATIVSKWLGSGNQRSFLFGVSSTSRVSLLISENGVSVSMNLLSVPTINLNQWYHLAVVGDIGTDNYKIYINGTEAETTGSMAISSIFNGIGKINLGATKQGTEDFFDGFIDEVKIYPYARSAAEIRQDYAAGLAGIGSSHGVSASFGSKSDSWLTDGLVGYWKMDESATTSGSLDSSGNGNTMTYYGDASTTPGKYSTAAEFDGNGDVVSILDANLSANFPGKSGYNAPAMTLSMWIKYDVVTGRTIRKPSIFQIASNEFGLRASSGSGYYQFTGISSGNWYHMVAVYNGQYIRGYLNGELNGVPIPLTGKIDSNTEEFDIGADGYPTMSDPSDSHIDEVRIYNRALSADEVRKLYEWAPGPVAHWKFDEHAGTTAYDSAASTTFSGGNHGTLGGGTADYIPTWTQGKYGGALLFDGNDRVKMGSLPYFDNLKAFTVSSWAKWSSSSPMNYNSITVVGGGFVALGGGWTDHKANMYTLSGTWRTPGNSTTNIDDSNWHYLTGLYDGVYLRLYIDGIQESANNVGALTYDNNGNYFQIGGCWGTTGCNADGEAWYGLIDDVRIYNYARTQKQILEDMNGSKKNLQSPILNLKFDEGKGGMAYDSSGYGNNGTLFPGTTGGNTATSAMWTLDGKLGRALEFDGTDDWIEVANESIFDFERDQPFSVSFWLKPDLNDSSAQTLVSKASDYSPWKGWHVLLNVFTSQAVAFCLTNSGGSDEMCVHTGNRANSYDGGWHRYQVVHDGSGEAAGAKIYEDGKAVPLTIAIDELDASILNDVKVNIGGRGGGSPNGGEVYKGLMDDVRIYPYALTEEEIKLDYNQGMSAVMGAVSSATAATSSNAASREYCIPGDTSYCAPPVGEWTFNEKTGTTTYDTIGNGNNGVFVSAGTSPAWQAAHKCTFGSCLEFDGSDDYIGITDSGTSVLDITSGITISAWIFPKVLQPEANHVGYIVDKGAYDGSTPQNYQFYQKDNADGVLEFDFLDGGGWNTHTTDSNSIIIDLWQFVTATYNGSNVYIYVNGLKVNQSTSESENSSMVANNENLWIGGTGGTAKFDGLIDQVRIYNYARTPAQIAWEYNRGEPVAWWRFDECSGGTIHDESGNGNNGQLFLGSSGVTATGTCASSSNSFWYNGRVGKYNSAGSFDQFDDYIVIPNSEILEGFNQMTVSVWILPQSSSWGGIVGDWNTAGDAGGWLLMQNNDAIVFYILSGATEKTAQFDHLKINNWNHIIGVYDGTNIKLFVDGALKDTEPQTGNANDADNQVWIGNYFNNNVFYGLIDEVKIWNYALTAEQVRTEYAGGAVKFGQ